MFYWTTTYSVVTGEACYCDVGSGGGAASETTVSEIVICMGSGFGAGAGAGTLVSVLVICIGSGAGTGAGAGAGTTVSALVSGKGAGAGSSYIGSVLVDSIGAESITETTG